MKQTAQQNYLDVWSEHPKLLKDTTIVIPTAKLYG